MIFRNVSTRMQLKGHKLLFLSRFLCVTYFPCDLILFLVSFCFALHWQYFVLHLGLPLGRLLCLCKEKCLLYITPCQPEAVLAHISRPSCFVVPSLFFFSSGIFNLLQTTLLRVCYNPPFFAVFSVFSLILDISQPCQLCVLSAFDDGRRRELVFSKNSKGWRHLVYCCPIGHHLGRVIAQERHINNSIFSLERSVLHRGSRILWNPFLLFSTRVFLLYGPLLLAVAAIIQLT